LTPERRRLLIALVAAVAVLGPLAYFWQASLLPSSSSVMDMGYADYGGGPRTMTDHRRQGVSVADLVADADRPADVDVTLTVRKERFRLATGEAVDGYTVNHTSPGPVIHAVQGQLVQVRLVNASVPDGVTLHWHGVDVPNAEDGVAGVTQNAVRVGSSPTASARTGTTRTRSRTPRSRAACWGRWWSARRHPSRRSGTSSPSCTCTTASPP
jgi:FtsP/CotA-like multicopper oxidase with cupredoxin domain